MMLLFVLFSTFQLVYSGIFQEYSADVVRIYGSAKCPDTTAFLRDQFMPFLKEFNVTNFYNGMDNVLPNGKKLSIEYYPVPIKAGPDDDHFTYQCFKGFAECQANIMQACALKYDKTNATNTLMCAQELPSAKFTDCIAKAGPDSLLSALDCAIEEGPKLFYDNYEEMKQLEQFPEYVPWIVINGKHVPRAEDDFKAAICALESMKDFEICC